MSCRFLVTRTNAISQMGPPAPPKAHYLCGLKLENEQQRFVVHHVLSEKGIGGHYVSDCCPVASSGKWPDCPYYRDILS